MMYVAHLTKCIVKLKKKKLIIVIQKKNNLRYHETKSCTVIIYGKLNPFNKVIDDYFEVQLAFQPMEGKLDCRLITFTICVQLPLQILVIFATIDFKKSFHEVAFKL